MSHDQARARIQERFGVAAEGAGPLLIVTVPPERWVELASFARDSPGCLYFNFLTAVDWNRRSGAADNARILLDYDQAGFEARVRSALAAR